MTVKEVRDCLNKMRNKDELNKKMTFEIQDYDDIKIEDFFKKISSCTCGNKPCMNEEKYIVWGATQKGNYSYWVECLFCGKKTRRCISPENAIKAWNKKMGKEEELIEKGQRFRRIK